MTAAKIKHMKESLNSQFSQVFTLCEFILGASSRPSLIKATLITLQRFLSWIPLGYIFETTLINGLLTKFFPAPEYRTATLDCLTEVASLGSVDLSDSYRLVLQNLLVSVMEHLSTVIPLDFNLQAAYENGSEEDCLFIHRLALFLTTFLTNHMKTVEKSTTDEVSRAIHFALMLTVRVSEVKDEDVFKTCLDFWQHFCKGLYNQDALWRSSSSGGGLVGTSMFLGRNLAGVTHPPQFDEVLHRLRHVMIDRMAKPEEVIVVEDDNGEIVREMAKDTEVIAQYKTMRETIIYLTHLNYEDTEEIMLEKLDYQVGRGQFTWQGLNTLCWAIGSISGSMSELAEKRFLVTVIKDLLRLCEEQRGKDNKAVVASNIMYIVGQYPRFLRAHWKFLKTVVNKLFEFMHEHHPGVQDMACDTFLKIAQKCKRKFMTIQLEEEQPFIYTLILELHNHIADLQHHQVQAFYEAVGTVLSDRGPTITISREEVLTRLMAGPNAAWQALMTEAQRDVSVLYQMTTTKEMTKIIKINAKVCSSAGPIYVHQLSIIFMDLINVYRLFSEQICAGVASHGEIATRWSQYKCLRGVKSDILDLMIAFLEQPPHAEEQDRLPRTIMQTFLPFLNREVLSDYKTAPATAKDSRVLTLYATAIGTLRLLMTSEIPSIMEAVFEPTLSLITKNMMDFPEHRVGFFKFLRAANEHCFFGLFNISPLHQKLVVDSVVWAFKHTERNVSETGLDILMELLQNVTASPEFAQAFYQTFLLSLIQDILEVLTDRLHKSGFKMQATALKHIFSLVQSGDVVVPLFDFESSGNPSVSNGHGHGLLGCGGVPGNVPQVCQENQRRLKEHVAGLILNAFPNLTKAQVIAFVLGLFDVAMDLNAFKQHLRDFLVTIKEFQSEDNSELFCEELEADRELARLQDWQYRSSVPGLLGPIEPDLYLGGESTVM
eukprot:gene2216-2648_t